MDKGDRYEIIKPLFIWKKIQKFSDIFKFIPKSPVAEKLGKEKGRFDELIKSPCGLTFGKVDKLCTLFKLTLDEMASLIEPQCSIDKKIDRKKQDLRYEIIGPVFKENLIRSFEDILNYIPKSVVADDIGKKGDRLDHLLKNIGDFPVKDLFVIANLSELTLAEIFGLVKVLYEKQDNQNKS
jgi:hypothetical protein